MPHTAPTPTTALRELVQAATTEQPDLQAPLDELLVTICETDAPEQGYRHSIRGLQSRLNDYQGPPAQRLSTLPIVTRAEAIDPQQPSFGARADWMPGLGLLAAAAHRLRANGDPICNVLILPSIMYADEQSSPYGLQTQRASVVSDLRVYNVNFDQPVGLDGTTVRGNSHLVGTPGLRFLNSELSDHLLTDKQRMRRWLIGSGVQTVPVLAEGFSASPNLENELWDIYDRQEKFVIKPVVGHQGEKVLMVDPRKELFTDIYQRFRQEYVADTAVTFEPWIQSLRLQDEAGERLDWNIRVVCYGGEVAGMYARVGRYGEPINIARGAQAMGLTEVLDNCQLTRAEQRQLDSDIRDFCALFLKRVPTGCTGLDIIINEQRQPVLNEANPDSTGGLENSVAMMHLDLAPAITAIRGIDSWLFRTGRWRSDDVPRALNPAAMMHNDEFSMSLMDVLRQPAINNNDSLDNKLVLLARRVLENMPRDWPLYADLLRYTG